MNTSKITILAASPFTKGFGIAAIYQNELIYFAVKTFKSPKTKQSVKRQISGIIRDIIEEFEPKMIILTKPSKHQTQSKYFDLINQQVKREAKLCQLPVFWTSFEVVKGFICPDEKRTKGAVFKAISKIYPELKQFINRPNKWQTDYWNPLLTAVALGYFYQQTNLKQK